VWACQTVVIKGERSEAGTVNLRVTHTLFGLKMRHRHIAAASGAELQVSQAPRQPDGSVPTPTFRVRFATADGLVPLTTGLTSNEKKHAALASRLDAVLKDPQQDTLHIAVPPGWGPWLVLTFLGTAFFLLYFLQGGELLLDKENDLVVLIKLGIPKPREQRFHLSEVDRFYLDWSTEINGVRKVAWLTLQLTSGKTVTLTQVSGFFQGINPRALLDKVERFRASAHQPALIRSRPSETASRTFVVPLAGGKICVVCGLDCSTELRYQDEQGRYYHQRCHSATGA
jgi:hypothetical protein